MRCQSEQEISSGGDQLISDKIDVYTIIGRLFSLPNYLSVYLIAKKTHFSFERYTYHLMN